MLNCPANGRNYSDSDEQFYKIQKIDTALTAVYLRGLKNKANKG